jgi:hypothetical protein
MSITTEKYNCQAIQDADDLDDTLAYWLAAYGGAG